MHVLIAPTSLKAAFGRPGGQRFGGGLARGWPPNQSLEIECLPVADGGEGTAEAIHDALAGRWVTLVVRDPLGRPQKVATP